MKDAQLNWLWRYNFVIISILAILLLQMAIQCNGHGRLIEPPSRASAWRYGFNTPPDYNDHEQYCGGLSRQWDRNGGKCGECGDPWDMPIPRPHEHGGAWGLGVIVRKYQPKSNMVVRIELTASHMGYFEFRLCPKPKATQECFDTHLLKVLSGTPSNPELGDLDTRFYPRNGSTIYTMKVLLPDIKCNQCVLQWRYVAGNNWGKCPNGNEGLGCGPQEEFRSCSDIAIGVSPVIVISTTTTTTTETSVSIDADTRDDLNLILLIFILTFIFGMCIYIGWYIKHNEQTYQRWRATVEKVFRRNHNNKNDINTPMAVPAMIPETIYICPPETVKDKDNVTFDVIPLPPPRHKRHKNHNDSNVA